MGPPAVHPGAVPREARERVQELRQPRLRPRRAGRRVRRMPGDALPAARTVLQLCAQHPRGAFQLRALPAAQPGVGHQQAGRVRHEVTLNPKPQTLNPRPYTLNPKP